MYGRERGRGSWGALAPVPAPRSQSGAAVMLGGAPGREDGARTR